MNKPCLQEMTQTDKLYHPVPALTVILVLMILSQTGIHSSSSWTLDNLQQCSFHVPCSRNCQEGTNISGCIASLGYCSCVSEKCWLLHGSCVHACAEADLEECLTCSRSAQGTMCDTQCTGVCVSPTCEHSQNITYCQTCLSGYYGQNCNGSCSSVCNGNCYEDTGYCKICVPRRFGQECEQICPDLCQTCSLQNGSCLVCMDGYTGKTCSSVCAEGFYGKHCAEPCSGNCANNCDHISGFCHEGCRPGYFGRSCLKTCPSGTYGQDCIAECPVTCAAGTTCHHINGSCLHGCTAGFHGDQCDAMCVLGTYGENCSRNCSQNCYFGVCNRFSGHCQVCTVGREGIFCENLMAAENMRNHEDTVTTSQTILIFLVLFSMGFCTWWFLGLFMHYKQRASWKKIEKTGKLPRRWASLVHVYPEYFNYPMLRQGSTGSRRRPTSSRKRKPRLYKGYIRRPRGRFTSNDIQEQRLLRELYKMMKVKLEEKDKKSAMGSGDVDSVAAGLASNSNRLTNIHTNRDNDGSTKEGKKYEGHEVKDEEESSKNVDGEILVEESRERDKNKKNKNKSKSVKPQDDIVRNRNAAEVKGNIQSTQEGAEDTLSSSALNGTLYSDTAQEGTRVSDIAHEEIRLSDIAPEATKLSDIAPKGTKLSDIAQEWTRLLDIAQEETRLSDIALEETRLLDLARRETRSVDTALDGTKSSAVTLEGTRSLDIAQQETRSSNIAHVGTLFSDIAYAGTMSPHIAQERKMSSYKVQGKNISSDIVQEEKKSVVTAQEQKRSAEAAEDKNRSLDTPVRAESSTPCPACGKRCLCSLQEPQEHHDACTSAIATFDLPAHGLNQLNATTNRKNKRQASVISSRRRSHTGSSLSNVRIRDKHPRETRAEEDVDTQRHSRTSTRSKKWQRQRSSKSKRTRHVQDNSSEAAPAETSTTFHSEVETSMTTDSESDNSTNTSTTVKEKTSSRTSTYYESSGSESPSRTLVSAGTSSISASNSASVPHSSTIKTPFSTNMTETSSEGLSTERIHLPSFQHQNFQAALERQSQNPFAKTDFPEGYDIENMASALPGSHDVEYDVEGNKHDQRNAPKRGLFHRVYTNLVSAVNKLFKPNSQSREETDTRAETMVSSSSHLPEWPSSGQFLISRLETWRRSQNVPREPAEHENTESRGLERSSSAGSKTGMDRTSTAEPVTDRSSTTDNTTSSSSKTKESSSLATSSEARTSRITSSQTISASTTTRSSHTGAYVATLSSSESEVTITEKGSTWADESPSAATQSSSRYTRPHGSSTSYPRPYVPKYSLDSSTKSHS